MGQRLLMLSFGLMATATCAKKQPRDWTPLSPSGEFQAIVTNQVAETGPLKGSSVWQVIIQDEDGKPVYIEPTSMRPWHLNNYWAWDVQDRFWVYDTDVGLFIIWEYGQDGWTKSFANETDTVPEPLKRFSK